MVVYWVKWGRPHLPQTGCMRRAQRMRIRKQPCGVGFEQKSIENFAVSRKKRKFAVGTAKNGFATAKNKVSMQHEK